MSPYPSIPGFEFTALIGRGGMATIYAARQLGLNRDVAVKVVEVSGKDAAQYVQRLEIEAQSLAQLRHPGIVGLYQFGRTDNGAMYYVMPLLEGGDLAHRSRPMGEDAVIKLLDQLLDALDHAHRAGIVHRDIKPENILYDGEQRPLLADFGAAQRPSLSRLTEAGMAIGSAGYMSPEQARGQVVDARSDLYSVGVLAFELLTDSLPFQGPDALSIALAQVEQQPSPLPPGLQQWKRWFDRALALDPKQRFATAAEMRAALGEMHTRQAPRQNVPPRASSRWRLAALAAIVLLSFTAAAYWWQTRTARTLEQISTLIAQGQLTAPSDPNALDLLSRMDGDTGEHVQALKDRVISDLWAVVDAPLQRSDWVAVATPLRHWDSAVDTLHMRSRDLVVDQREFLAEHVRPALEQALRQFDRKTAEPLLMLLQEMRSLPVEIGALVTQLQELPSVGEHFADDGGPPLLLLKPPATAEPGLAIMTAALSPELYTQFAVNTQRLVSDCTAATPNLRGCVSQSEAAELAQWLSVQTGQQYRLPSIEELQRYVARIEPADGSAWTNTCQEITVTTKPNAAKRTWGGIKRVFGGKGAQPQVERHCRGHWLVSLNGEAKQSARSSAATNTTAVLIREIAAIPSD